MTIKITVNGVDRSCETDADKPLLWVLREDLDLPGTKFGCGVGLCGACTVILDGQAVRSCQTPVGDAAAKSVVTIEGVSTLPTGRKVVDAWVDIDVPQCGYCQAGQIMSATALLTETPHPSHDEIVAGMVGNICRCSTYLRIERAIRQAAGIGDAA